jgi:hypothetical protein
VAGAGDCPAKAISSSTALISHSNQEDLIGRKTGRAKTGTEGTHEQGSSNNARELAAGNSWSDCSLLGEGTFVPGEQVTFIFKDQTRFEVIRAKSAFDQANELKPLPPGRGSGETAILRIG